MIINGVKLEDINELRDNIKENFGSLSSFSIQTDISYFIVKKIFISLNINKEDFAFIKKTYEENVDKAEVRGKITTEEAEKIRISIVTHFKTYRAFAKEHPEYDGVYITNVLNQRLKLKTKKYNEFINLLTTKYGLKLNQNESN